MPRLSIAKRALAIGLLRSGKSCIKVAQDLGVHKSTIHHLRIKVDVLGLEKGVLNQPGGHRKRKTTVKQEALLLE